MPSCTSAFVFFSVTLGWNLHRVPTPRASTCNVRKVTPFPRQTSQNFQKVPPRSSEELIQSCHKGYGTHWRVHVCGRLASLHLILCLPWVVAEGVVHLLVLLGIPPFEVYWKAQMYNFSIFVREKGPQMEILTPQASIVPLPSVVFTSRAFCVSGFRVSDIGLLY